MTTAQGTTTHEFQQMGEDFHRMLIDGEKLTKNLKDFLALRNQPERDQELLKSWKRMDDVDKVLMPRSHDTALKVDDQISELLKAFDEAKPGDPHDLLHRSIYNTETFIKDGIRVKVEFAHLRHWLGAFEKTELDWRLRDYRLSLVQSGALPNEAKDVPLPIEQLFSDTFASLDQRLTTMEHFWLRLKDDEKTLRQKVTIVTAQHGSKEFDEMKKDAYSFALNMHRNIEAYALAFASAEKAPILHA